MRFRKEYIEALELLGRAFDEMARAGFERPILVGGGAVEFYTAGGVVSGDFDIVTPTSGELDLAFLKRMAGR
jgi:hypothetical protein